MYMQGRSVRFLNNNITIYKEKTKQAYLLPFFINCTKYFYRDYLYNSLDYESTVLIFKDSPYQSLIC